MLAFLAGEGRAPSGETLELSELTVLAPVPEPPSVRDFYAYEGHVAAGARLRGREIAPYWYEAPAFYFSNPAAILGPGEPVARPASTAMLDFELEIAAVIGLGGDGEPEIAGFTLMNDWWARDVQAGEVTVGLGPAKAKDFATSVGPWIVTPDELPYADGRLEVLARVFVNGSEIAAGRAPSSTSAGTRSSPTPPATRACDPATCSARAPSPAAACWSSGRSSRRVGESRAGSSPATWSRSRPTASGGSRPRWSRRGRRARHRRRAGRAARLAAGEGAAAGAPLVGLEHAALEQGREHHLGLGADHARGVADPLQRLLEVLGVGGADVEDRARGRRRSCRPPRPRGSRRPRRGPARPTSAPRRRARRTRACSSRSPRGRRSRSSRG